jgi:hypothetical protein
MNYRLYFGENQRRIFSRTGTICFRSFDCDEREIQNFKAAKYILWWQSLLTKLESHLKPNCLKISIPKKEAEDFLNKNRFYI